MDKAKFDSLVEEYLPKFSMGLKYKEEKEEKKFKEFPGMAVEYVSYDGGSYVGLYLGEYNGGYVVEHQVDPNDSSKMEYIIQNSKRLYGQAGTAQEKRVFRENVEVLFRMLKEGKLYVDKGDVLGVGDPKDGQSIAWYIDRVGGIAKYKKEFVMRASYSDDEKIKYAINVIMTKLPYIVKVVDLKQDSFIGNKRKIYIKNTKKEFSEEPYLSILKCICATNDYDEIYERFMDMEQQLSIDTDANDIEYLNEMGQALYYLDAKRLSNIFPGGGNELNNAFKVASYMIAKEVDAIKSNSGINGIISKAISLRTYSGGGKKSMDGLNDDENAAQKKIQDENGIKDGNFPYLVKESHFTNHIAFLSTLR